MVAKHVIISDECRRSRTDEGALEEALKEIKEEYNSLCEVHFVGNGVRFHVTLDVEMGPNRNPPIFRRCT
jgi:hypothetical protein